MDSEGSVEVLAGGETTEDEVEAAVEEDASPVSEAGAFSLLNRLLQIVEDFSSRWSSTAK